MFRLPHPNVAKGAPLGWGTRSPQLLHFVQHAHRFQRDSTHDLQALGA